MPGGAADLDGRIMTGDELISIDSQSTINTSHDYVINLMGQASRNGCVTLGVHHIKPNYKSNCEYCGTYCEYFMEIKLCYCFKN